MSTKEEMMSHSNPSQSVKYDPKSETVTFPNGLVSVAGVTVVTGGAELSCGSCLLAFGFWGTLVGLSLVSVGLWDHSVFQNSGVSHLLALGLFLLLTSSGLIAVTVLLHFVMKKRKKNLGGESKEGNFVLVNEYAEVVLKRVTV